MDLLAAVRAQESAEAQAPLSDSESTDIDALAPDAEVETEEQEPAQEQEQEDGGDQYIELAAATEGGEPERIPVADAVRAVQEMRQLEGRVEEIVSLAEERANARAVQVYQQQDQMLQQTATVLQTWMTGLSQMAPKPPDPAMLNPQSQNYNPDAYNMQKAQFEQVNGAFQQIAAQHQQILQEQQRVANERHERYLDIEQEKLYRADPTWRTDFENKTAEIRSVMRERYGFDEATLMAIGDHRFFRAAADIVKLHKLEKGGKEAQAKIKGNGAAKAPAQAQGARVAKPGRESAPRDEKGKYVAQAAKELSTGPYTQEKGRNFFLQQIRSGRIK